MDTKYVFIVVDVATAEPREAAVTFQRAHDRMIELMLTHPHEHRVVAVPLGGE